MMATSTAKRSKFLIPSGGVIQWEDALQIAQKAAGLEFPWDDAVLGDIAN